MKKIFNTYNNPAEYIADTKEPNSVSLVKGDDTALDKVLFDGEYRCTRDKNKARVGDIVCRDGSDNYIWYMSPSYYLKHKDTPYEDFYHCVGVVVITPDEGMDELIHVVVCRYMDYRRPFVGSSDGVLMYWGNPNTSVSTLTNSRHVTCVIPGTTTISGRFSGLAKLEFPYGSTIQGDADVYSMWKDGGNNGYIPSPYDHSLGVISGSVDQAFQANGSNNTNRIISVVNHTGDITNSSDAGHYPAAECCRRYEFHYRDENGNTLHENVYLPSAKELLYLAARFETINTSLMLCGMSSLVDKRLWSSNQCSTSHVFNLDTADGLLRDYQKGSQCYVLGFINMGSSSIIHVDPTPKA